MGVRLTVAGVPLVAGEADGVALASEIPLSFWGGVDPESGAVIDRHHPWCGQAITGRVLVLPQGRGSCSASGVFLEAVANGTGPAAVIVSSVDPIIGLGAVLADELLQRRVPVVLVPAEKRVQIASGDQVQIREDGTIKVRTSSDETPHPIG